MSPMQLKQLSEPLPSRIIVFSVLGDMFRVFCSGLLHSLVPYFTGNGYFCSCYELK